MGATTAVTPTAITHPRLELALALLVVLCASAGPHPRRRASATTSVKMANADLVMAAASHTVVMIMPRVHLMPWLASPLLPDFATNSVTMEVADSLKTAASPTLLHNDFIAHVHFLRMEVISWCV